MIGYWHHYVVRLSVCLSVTLCTVAPRVGNLVYRAKSCASVLLAGKFVFVRSDTLAVGTIV